MGVLIHDGKNYAEVRKGLAGVYTNSHYYPQEEQITDISGFTKLYDTSALYGNNGARVNAALGVTNESTIATRMGDGWNSQYACYYDAENQLGAYVGYSFGEELNITKAKFWIGRYAQQNKSLYATVQWLDSNGVWNDLEDFDISVDLPYPTNMFESNLNFPCYGVRWIHKNGEHKTSGNNIVFFGMTLYEGSGTPIDVYRPHSGYNEVPVGYGGFGPVVV